MSYPALRVYSGELCILPALTHADTCLRLAQVYRGHADRQAKPPGSMARSPPAPTSLAPSSPGLRPGRVQAERFRHQTRPGHLAAPCTSPPPSRSTRLPAASCSPRHHLLAGALHFALCPLVVIARYYVYFKIRTQWTQLDSAASSLIKLVGALYVFTSSLRPPGITYYTFSYLFYLAYFFIAQP